MPRAGDAETQAGQGKFASWLVECGLGVLLVSTPLALGSVSRTATALMEGACFALLILAWWWGGPEKTPVPRNLKILAGLFVLWSLLQVVPLPPRVLQVVSPGTSRLYARFLPGYADGNAPTDLQAWLLDRKETPSASLSPGMGHETGFEGKLLVRSGWRPISWFPASTFFWISRFLAYWSLFLLAAQYLPEQACRKRIPWLLLLLGALIAVQGMLQHLAWNGKIYWVIPVYQGHPFGPWVNSNHFSGYLELIFPIAGAVFLQVGGWSHRRRRRRRHSRQHRIPLLLVVSFSLVFMSTALLMARSRGGLFSLLVTFALYLSHQMTVGEWGVRRPRLARVLAFVVVLLIGAGIATYALSATPSGPSGEDGMEPSFSSRVQAWKGVLKMIAANPFSGTGLGTFGLAYPVFKTYGTTAIWDQAHNEYLQLLAESGLVGFVLLICGIGVLWLRHLSPVLTRPWRRQEPMALGASLGVATLLLHSLVDFNLQIPSNGLLFAFLLGIAVRFAGEGGSQRDGRPGEEAGGSPSPG